MYTQQTKEACADNATPDSFRLSGRGNGHAALASLAQHHLLERSILFLPREERQGPRATLTAPLGVELLNEHQAVRLSERERAQHRRVEHAEDRRGRPDARANDRTATVVRPGPLVSMRTWPVSSSST